MHPRLALAMFIVTVTLVGSGLAVIVFPGEAVWLLAGMVPVVVMALLFVNLCRPRQGEYHRAPMASASGGGQASFTPQWDSLTSIHPTNDESHSDFNGLWSGTLTVRSSHGGAIRRVHSVNFEFKSDEDCTPLDRTYAYDRTDQSLAMELIEHDTANDRLFVRIHHPLLANSRRGYPTTLLRRNDRWLSEDVSGPICVELLSAQ